jgi:hypothetical protein
MFALNLHKFRLIHLFFCKVHEFVRNQYLKNEKKKSGFFSLSDFVRNFPEKLSNYKIFPYIFQKYPNFVIKILQNNTIFSLQVDLMAII